ncbi:MAG TPA: amino acid ABC transporter permease [Actinocrinis sp.]|uniref:amino acid ABC transporter permease n=1 Tax=Actinocrinis sp. TaxID=1920516 RepID=UPI002D4BD6AA|nr:amino acid ABC transporter permease [Actinocrinis sp.]HZU55633.1 amino acid ABC transporter permease [Actinocrinis sp.]
MSETFARDATAPRQSDPAENYRPSARQLERERYRARKRRRDGWIAVTCTTVFAVVAGALVVLSPGWQPVKDTFLSGSEFTSSFPKILDGFWLNVQMFLIAEPAILVLGLVVALVRSTRAPGLLPVRLLAVGYVDIFRGTPTLLVVLAVGFGIPALQLQGTPSQPWILGTIALVLSYGAYVAEVFRAGLNSVHPSQRNAARALGLTEAQAMRYVVLPQAVRNVVPPLLNDFVSLQKDTALVATLGPLEALRQAQIAADSHFNYTPYLGSALLFVAVTVPLARYTDRLATRAAERQFAGAAR